MPSDSSDKIKYLVDLSSLMAKRSFKVDTQITQFCHPMEKFFSIDAKSSETNELSLELKRFHRFARNVYRGHAANPNRSEIVDKLSASYVRIGLPVSGCEYEMTEKERELKEHLENSKFFAIMGKRGSGKTAFINNWLNLYTKNFVEKDLKTSWFRVDATKIYDMWNYPQTFDVAGINVESYFKIHAVYVYVVYAGLVGGLQNNISDLFRQIHQEIENSANPEISKRYREKIIAIDNHISKIVARDSGTLRENFVSEFSVKDIFTHGNSKARKIYSDLFEILSNAMSDLGISIWAIVDGIDNVSWSKNSQKYLRLCNDLSDFVENFEQKIGKADCTFTLLTRPETIPEIQHIILADGYNNENQDQATKPTINFGKIDISLPSISDILSCKLGAIENEDAFKHERTNCKNEIQELADAGEGGLHFGHIISEIKEYSSSILDLLVTDINKLTRESKQNVWKCPNIGKESLLEILFDSNIRAFLDAFFNICSARQASIILGVPHAEDPVRQLLYMFNDGDLVKYSNPFERKYRNKQIPRGCVFPNIFWYDPKGMGDMNFSIWHGLCGLRILQLVRTQAYVGGEIIHILSKLFGYDEKIVASHLEDFVAFGLIDIDPSKRNIAPRFDKISERAKKYKGFVEISKKGMLNQQLSFSYFDWMLSCAFDTPMHEGNVLNSSRIKFWRDYFDKKIINYYLVSKYFSLTSFVRHINIYHTQEMDRVKGNLEAKTCEKTSTIFSRTEMIDTYFSLPDWFEDHFNKEMSIVLNYCNSEKKFDVDNAKTNFSELSDIIIGAFEESNP